MTRRPHLVGGRHLAADTHTRRAVAVDAAGDFWTRLPGEDWALCVAFTVRRSVGRTSIVVAVEDDDRVGRRPTLRLV